MNEKLLSLTVPGIDGKSQQIAAPGGVPTGGIETGQKAIGTGTSLLIVVAVILAIFFLIWGGIQWTTSQGDKSKLDAARKKITFAIIGLIVVILSFFIVSVFGYFFGVQLLGQ